jgi:hypothetical protein
MQSITCAAVGEAEGMRGRRAAPRGAGPSESGGGAQNASANMRCEHRSPMPM